MKRLISYNVFEGDPNFIREGQILVIRDNSTTDKVLDIQQRVNGKLQSILTKEEPVPEEKKQYSQQGHLQLMQR